MESPRERIWKPVTSGLAHHQILNERNPLAAVSKDDLFLSHIQGKSQPSILTNFFNIGQERTDTWKTVFIRAQESPELWLPALSARTPAVLTLLVLKPTKRLRVHRLLVNTPCGSVITIMRFGHHSIIQQYTFDWWMRNTQFGVYPNCMVFFPSCEETESTWLNKRSEMCRWTMSGNDKLTADLFFFFKSKISLREQIRIESVVHPTKLWHFWSGTWKLDSMQYWIIALCNFNACSVFSRRDPGLS